MDFDEVEQFWAEQVKEYFRNKPSILSADTSIVEANQFLEKNYQAIRAIDTI